MVLITILPVKPESTYVPRELGKGTFYLMGLKDSNNNYLLADGNYKLTVQKEIPAEQFWSVIAYGIDDKAFISTEANRPGPMNAYMGTEIDFVIGLKLAKDVYFNAGYSQMFATSTMEALKGGSKDATSNWAWTMITIKPTLFTTKKEDNQK